MACTCPRCGCVITQATTLVGWSSCPVCDVEVPASLAYDVNSTYGRSACGSDPVPIAQILMAVASIALAAIPVLQFLGVGKSSTNGESSTPQPPQG